MKPRGQKTRRRRKGGPPGHTTCSTGSAARIKARPPQRVGVSPIFIRTSMTVSGTAGSRTGRILRAGRGQQRQTPVTAAGDEVQLVLTVAALQAFGHEDTNQNPRP